MGTHDETGQVELATAALAEVNDELMARPEVVGTFAGLLRDAEGVPTAEVGIVVLVDPGSASAEAAQRTLPDNIGGFPVQVRPSAPGLEGG